MLVRSARCLLIAIALVVAMTGCPNPGPADAGVDGWTPLATPGHCAATDQAPIRNGQGGFTCTPVGSDGTPTPVDWPDTAGLPTPVSYVQSGATGGDGSMAHPFATIGEALAAVPAPHGIAVARGSYALAASIQLTGVSGLEIRGAGPATGTSIVPAAGIEGFLVSGTATDVTLRGLSIEYAAPSAADSTAGIHVTGGAHLTARNVRVDQAYNGLWVEGSVLQGDRLTITRAGHFGLWVARDMGGIRSDATLDNVLVRDGAFVGIFALESRLGLSQSGVIHNTRDGVAISGGDGTSVSRLDHVTALGNGVTGLRVEGDGAIAHMTLVAASGTVVPAGTVGGDGLYVGPGAHVEVDMGILSDAQRATASELVGNARAGVLVSSNTDGGAHIATLELHGADVSSNVGPGVFVQLGSNVHAIAYAAVRDNGSAGIAATSQAVIAGVQCTEIGATRLAAIATTDGTFTIGDGITLSQGTVGMVTTLRNNVFSNNARFGVLSSGNDVAMTGNSGAGNGYGVGSYGGTLNADATNTIAGAAAAPAAPAPAARGQLLGVN